VYNYHGGYEYCAEKLTEPRKQEGKGTWGCNGEYCRLAYSNGTDLHKHEHTSIISGSFDVTAVTGSAGLHFYAATDTPAQN
jgi:hypothetical protein